MCKVVHTFYARDLFFSDFYALLTCAQRVVTRGIRVEYAWNTRGIRVEYVWNTRGIRVEYAWNTRGIRVEYAWNTRGNGPL